MSKIIKKSIAASLLIAIGCMVLLTVGAPLGAFLFSFGLLTVCSLDLYLYTGRCGYVVAQKNWKVLGIILLVNLAAGWLIGALIGVISPALVPLAAAKILTWTNPFIHFIQAIFCGGIMFIAVEIKKRGSILGILLGVPVFILCGFQHCIANIIYLGVALTFNPIIILSIIGNLLGALGIWFLSRDD